MDFFVLGIGIMINGLIEQFYPPRDSDE